MFSGSSYSTSSQLSVYASYVASLDCSYSCSPVLRACYFLASRSMFFLFALVLPSRRRALPLRVFLCLRIVIVVFLFSVFLFAFFMSFLCLLVNNRICLLRLLLVCIVPLILLSIILILRIPFYYYQ